MGPHFQLVEPGIYKYHNNNDLVRHNFHKLIDLLDSIPFSVDPIEPSLTQLSDIDN